MTATGLSATPKEYRQRLEGQPDEQIDAWTAELMRDVSIRRGVRHVLRDLMHAARLTEPQLERVFAAGNGAPAIVGRTAEGELMMPAASLHHLVPGLRRTLPNARDRMIEYLVENFEELVYL